MTEDGAMGGDVVNLIPEPQPDHNDWILRFRARVATDIADGRATEMIFGDLITALDDRVAGARAAIITVDKDSFSHVAATSLPPEIASLIHGARRRDWFGSWAAAISRHSSVTVIDVVESSLYREHRPRLTEHGLVAARATPLRGRHHLVAGALVAYLPEARLFTADEGDILDLVAELAGLAIRRDLNRQELLDRIRFDPLTGLENRDGLEEILRRALTTVGIDGPGVGLLFVDIDDLTLINDSLGHTAGDTVIATTASRIKNHLMHSDTVVRFGGDEFIVVLDRVHTATDAHHVADRIRRSIAEPLEVGGTQLTTTVSIGITIGHANTDPLELVDEGHAAVVRAKQSGRGSTAHHDRILDGGAGERLGREVELRDALAEDQFVVHWQPKVNLSTGHIVGAEALIRWDQPGVGIVGPDQFLRTAERAGLTAELSDWVLEQSLSEGAEIAREYSWFSVAVNLPATEIARPEIVDNIERLLDETGFPRNQLIIELTESVLAEDSAVAQLHALRNAGIRVAIDDFGTGYSSLAYVQQLPVQIVKIDRAFLDGLRSDGSGAPVLAAAIAMAQALGMSTTVEGVETPGQLEALRRLGVDLAQGYLFSAPLPCAALTELLLSDGE